MKFQHTRSDICRRILILGSAAAFLMIQSSCTSSGTQTTNSGNTEATAANPQPSVTATPELPIVTRLDQVQVGSTANFKAPNGKVFKVVFREAEPEYNAAPGNDTNSVAHGPHNQVCDGEAFDGSDRKVSKTKPSDAQVEDFAGLSDFIDTLASDDDMGTNHQPAIATSPTSARVKEEKRNVHIGQAWLYTFSRESDEDYHVIIGTTDDRNTAKFFNVEISGLPGNSSAAFEELNQARNTFKDFFGLTECSGGYTADIMDNPQEIDVTGSPFFDKLHFVGHASIGPSYARSSSYWEIHPVTKIVFK